MTIIDICNVALARLGAEIITSLDDNTKRSGLCKTLYEVMKNEMLESHPWRFARKRKKSVGSVSNTFGWAFKHQLPADFERIVTTEEQEEYWEIEGTTLYSDSQTLNYIYIPTILEDKYPSYFVVALASRLAKEMSYSLVQSTELQQTIEVEYEKKLSSARFTDSSGTGYMQYKANDWAVVRP